MPKRKIKESEKKTGKHQSKTPYHGKLHTCDEPELSSILKIPVTGQEIPGTEQEGPDEFDPPLHSTAVSDLEEEDEEKDRPSEPNRKIQDGVNSEVKRKNSKEEAVKEKMRSQPAPTVENSKQLSALPLRTRTRAKPAVQQNEDSSTVTQNSDDDSSRLRKVWGPRGMKKVASSITQTDVILDELEKIASKYKQGVKSKMCWKAIDRFYIEFRDQLTSVITDTEELKQTKLKNAKMVRAINKKRQRLIEVKEELIRTEPQLKMLEKESAQLKERLSSFRNAVQFINDLEDLQQKYVSDRKKNPQEKISYGVCSVPALLVESRTILGVENDFQNMESKLEQLLDLQENK